MKNILAICGKELKGYFVSPIAYVVLMLFLVMTGYFFYGNIVNFQRTYQYYQTIAQIYKNPQIMERLNVNSIVIEGLLFNMLFIMLFLMPAIMMRSFAEEKRNGTEELLMTSPLTVNQIIAGKFIGSLAFVVVLLIPTVIYQILLFSFSTPELGPVLTGYLGIVGFACVGIAIGMFASSLTQNQIIAMVISFVCMLMLFVIGMIDPGDDTNLGKLVRYLAVSEHAGNLMKGMIDTKDLVYFASLTTLFIFLTKQSVESVRWR
jgi:ABC-2 type transport system permease protein